MNVLKIEKCAVNAGEGFRTVIWASGCEHNCYNCHNPETWDCKKGYELNYSLSKKIIDYVNEHDYINGISLTGGDPLFPNNRNGVEAFLENYIKLCKKSVWCWTGYLWEEVKDLPLIQYIDILVDGPYIDTERDITLKWRGSKNQRIINVKQSLKENKVILYGE